MLRQIFLVSIAVLLSVSNYSVYAASVNLISNSSVETSTSNTSVPDGWIQGSWGTNTSTWSYPVTGSDGGKVVKITMTSITDGDAKWAHPQSSVTAGRVYTFTDQYKSDVVTKIAYEFTDASGVKSYSGAEDVPASPDTWGTVERKLTIPNGVTTVTVFHVINTIGFLTTDNYSLTESDVIDVDVPSVDLTPVGTNILPNPSFEVQGDNGPLSWNRGGWGNNIRSFTYPVSGKSGGSATRVELASITDGDVKWSSVAIRNVGGKRFRFTQTYRANVPTYVDVRYTRASGDTFEDIGILIEGDGTWRTYQTDFEVPSDVISLKVMAILTKVGFLEVDDMSLVERPGVLVGKGTITLAFDDGFKSTFLRAIPILNARGIRSSQYLISDYVSGNTNGFYLSTQDMLAMQLAGHEIAAHTRTHPHLTALTQPQLLDEVTNSRKNLISLGASPVATFTYPYGEYNETVKQAVRDAGYIGARSVNQGFNNKNTDKYVLLDKHVEKDTAVASIKGWIDQAIQNDTWLILEMHQQLVNCGGEQYCNTEATLTEIADYIKQSGIKVVTVAEGVGLMNQ